MTSTSLIFWHPGVDQFFINVAFSQFSKISQYNSNFGQFPLPLLPTIVISHLVANSNNCTLVETSKQTSLSNSSGPVIHPYVQISNDFLHTYNIRRSNINDTGQRIKIELVQVEPMPDNFVYCDNRVKEGEEMLSFFSFLNTFEPLTWFCIATTLIVQRVYTKISKCVNTFWRHYYSQKCNLKSNKLMHNKYDYWAEITSLVFSVFLMNIYSSLVTSTMIIPPTDKMFDTITDIPQNKFGLLVMEEFNNTLHKYRNRDSVFQSREVKAISLYLENTTYVQYMYYLEEMAFWYSKPFVSVMEWPWVIRFVLSLNSLLEMKGKGRVRKCYLGKQLFFSGYHHRYFAFFQRTTDGFRKTFQHLVEAGIYMRWEQESVGWVHSLRMQDRFKLVSKTKVIDDFDEIKFYALRMEGSILRPFILYVVCILLCFTFFFIEKM